MTHARKFKKESLANKLLRVDTKTREQIIEQILKEDSGKHELIISQSVLSSLVNNAELGLLINRGSLNIANQLSIKDPTCKEKVDKKIEEAAEKINEVQQHIKKLNCAIEAIDTGINKYEQSKKKASQPQPPLNLSAR